MHLHGVYIVYDYMYMYMYIYIHLLCQSLQTHVQCLKAMVVDFVYCLQTHFLNNCDSQLEQGVICIVSVVGTEKSNACLIN